MKKVIALLVALVMCFSMATVAMAEEVNTYCWEDIVDTVAEEGYEGDFYSLGAVNLMVWVPDFMECIELSDDALEAGFIASFEDEEQSFILDVTMNETQMTYEECLDYLAAAVAVDNFGEAEINGLPVIVYIFTNDAGDTVYAVSLLTDDGYVIEFLFNTDSAESMTLAGYMASSIQIYEE